MTMMTIESRSERGLFEICAGERALMVMMVIGPRSECLVEHCACDQQAAEPSESLESLESLALAHSADSSPNG